MGKYMLLFIGVMLTISCEQTECCVNPKVELHGRFIHEIPNCDNSDKPEINCTEWLEFVNENEVDILYGGGDIVYRFDYVRDDTDILSLEGELTSSFKVSFEIVDPKTLVRLDTEEVWKKVE